MARAASFEPASVVLPDALLVFDAHHLWRPAAGAVTPLPGVMSGVLAANLFWQRSERDARVALYKATTGGRASVSSSGGDFEGR